jgi:glycosyltransferase involved in cell wall biosynthesis
VPPTPILFCSHVTELGGAEHVLLDLLGELDRDDVEPHLACPDDGPLAQRARALAVPVHHVPIGGRSPWAKALSLPVAAHALRKTARALNCRTLVANSMIAGYAAVIAQHHELRAVWHLHIVTRSRVLRWACRRAAVLITPSRAGAEVVARDRLGTPRVEVVPNGVPKRFFGGPAADLRHRLSVPDQAPLLGIIGRLDPHKGHRVLLDALALLGTGAAAPHLVIVGGEAFAGGLRRIAGEAERLRTQAAALGLTGRVHWLGELADTAPIYRGVDAVIVPSVSAESAPRTITEAQAAGTAVVASRIGGTPELIEHARTGLLVRPGDATDLAAAIGSLQQPDLRQRLAEAARAMASRDYAMRAFAIRCTRAILAAWPAACDRTARRPGERELRGF